MASLTQIDYSKPIPEAKLYIAKPNKNIIGSLKMSYNKTLHVRLRDTDQLTFNVLLKYDVNGVLTDNPQLENIRESFLIKVVYNGETQWFKIQRIIDSSDDNKDEIQVTAYSLEIELSQKKLLNYTATSKNCTQVLTDALNGTRWTIDSVDPIYDLMFRDFDINKKSALDFILSDMVTTTFVGALAQFDTETRKVKIVQESSVGTNKGLKIKYGQYMNAMTKEQNSENIVTRLYCFGDQDLTISSVTATGNGYIDDFIYYLGNYEEDDNGNVLTSSEWMSDSLAGALTAYNALLATKEPTSDTAETGTTTTTIKLTAHGLSTGDYIVNTDRSTNGNKVTVVDANTLTVSAITGQTVGDNIDKYPLGTIGYLIFKKTDLQSTLTTQQNDLDDLNTEKLVILDLHVTQTKANTIDTFAASITNTTKTRTLSSLDSSDHYVAMCNISTTTGTTVKLNGTGKTFTADTWTVLGKLTGSTSYNIAVTTTGTNVTMKTLIIKITSAEYSASGNESDLINNYCLDHKQIEIDSKQGEIDNTNTSITSVDADIATLRASVSESANFTTEQLDELKDFIYEDDFRDSNYTHARDLYNAGKAYQAKVNAPQILFTVDSVDFMQMITEQHNWTKLNLNDEIIIQHDKLGINISARLLEIEHDFENQKIKLTIGDGKENLTMEDKFIRMLTDVPKLNSELKANKSKWTVLNLNFNDRNDRISVKPADPTILTDLTAITSKVNTDGSSDITFNWTYSGTGNSYNIDGFFVYLHSSDSDNQYSFGSILSQNDHVSTYKSDQRSMKISGQPSDRYYTFGVQAYRIVDPDVESSGILRSNIVQCSVFSQNPYLPSSSVNYTGNLNGTATSTVVSNANDAYVDTSNYRDSNAPNGTFACNSLTSTTNTDGSIDIKLTWGYTQGSNGADGYIILYETGNAVVPTSASHSFYQDATTTKFILSGVPANVYHNFKICAYRSTNTGIKIGTLTNAANWLNYRASTTPNYTGNLNGTSASSVVSNANNSVQQGTTYNNVKITETNGIQVLDASNNERVKIGDLGSSQYGIQIKKADGTVSFNVDSNGEVQLLHGQIGIEHTNGSKTVIDGSAFKIYPDKDITTDYIGIDSTGMFRSYNGSISRFRDAYYFGTGTIPDIGSGNYTRPLSSSFSQDTTIDLIGGEWVNKASTVQVTYGVISVGTGSGEYVTNEYRLSYSGATAITGGIRLTFSGYSAWFKTTSTTTIGGQTSYDWNGTTLKFFVTVVG